MYCLHFIGCVKSPGLHFIGCAKSPGTECGWVALTRSCSLGVPSGTPTQTSLYVSPPAATSGRLPLVPWTALAHLRNLGKGAFGDVALMDWSARGLTVAVKCNGTDCVDGAEIENERRLYELLKDNPHDNILPVHGICTDAPDGKVRLVMKYSPKGSLSDYLTGTAKPEVCVCLCSGCDWVHLGSALCSHPRDPTFRFSPCPPPPPCVCE